MRQLGSFEDRAWCAARQAWSFYPPEMHVLSPIAAAACRASSYRLAAANDLLSQRTVDDLHSNFVKMRPYEKINRLNRSCGAIASDSRVCRARTARLTGL